MSVNKPVKFQIKIPSNCWENSQKTLGGYFILPHPVLFFLLTEVVYFLLFTIRLPKQQTHLLMTTLELPFILYLEVEVHSYRHAFSTWSESKAYITILMLLTWLLWYTLKVLVIFAQYICATRYQGPRFVADAMYKHFPNAGNILSSV